MLTRRFAAVASLVGALAAVVGVLLPARTAAAEPATVVVGVTGLTWSDVRSSAGLSALVGQADVGSISVKSATQRTCPLDGWSTLSAGTRTWVSDLPPAGCPSWPAVTSDQQVSGWAQLQALQLRHHTSAALGELGSRIPGRCGFGPGGAVATADRSGRLGYWRPTWPTVRSGVVQTLRTCRLSVVDGGTLPGDRSGERTAALSRLAGTVAAARSAGAQVWLVGIADDAYAGSSARQVLAALRLPPAGSSPRWLTSSSTRRAGIIQIPDLTATLLARAGATPDVPLGGGAISVTGDAHVAADNGAVITDRLAANQRFRLPPPMLGVTAAILVLLQVGALLWFWRRRTAAARRAAVGALLTMGGFFSAVFLVTATVWWRSPAPALTLVVGVVVLSALVALVGWRLWRAWPALPVAAAAMLTLVVDGLLGTPMQWGGMFSNGPVTGGRFYGFGNSTFSALAVGTLVTCAAVATRLRERSPQRAALAVLGIGFVGIAIDGGPWWGVDFGGVVALAPAVLLFAWYVWRGRVSVRAVVLAGVIAVALVAAIAFLDYLRPPGSRTDLGDFVARLADGSALDVVRRKMTYWLGFVDSPIGVVGLLVSLTLMYLSGFPRRIPWPAIHRLLDEQPLLRPLLACIAVCALIGMLINDAGPMIPLISYGMVVPLLVATVLTHDRPAAAAAPVPRTERIMA